MFTVLYATNDGYKVSFRKGTYDMCQKHVMGLTKYVRFDDIEIVPFTEELVAHLRYSLVSDGEAVYSGLTYAEIENYYEVNGYGAGLVAVRDY